MKKIIEVVRGVAVPDDARWLKDVKRVVSEDEVDDGSPLGPETIRTYQTFDVFEVELTLAELRELLPSSVKP